MVYRGRPSTGCKKCRERKIKVSRYLFQYKYPSSKEAPLVDYFWPISTMIPVPVGRCVASSRYSPRACHFLATRTQWSIDPLDFEYKAVHHMLIMVSSAMKDPRDALSALTEGSHAPAMIERSMLSFMTRPQMCGRKPRYRKLKQLQLAMHAIPFSIRNTLLSHARLRSIVLLQSRLAYSWCRLS